MKKIVSAVKNSFYVLFVAAFFALVSVFAFSSEKVSAEIIVNGDPYSSIQNAIIGSGLSGSITIDVDGEYNECLSINAGSSVHVTINLTGAIECQSGGSAVAVTGGAKVTLNGGSYYGGGNGTIMVSGGSTANINVSLIQDPLDGAAIMISNGTVNYSSGRLYQNQGLYAVYLVEGSFAMTGGTIESVGNYPLFVEGGTATISSGTLAAKEQYAIYAPAGSVSWTGGTLYGYYSNSSGYPFYGNVSYPSSKTVSTISSYYSNLSRTLTKATLTTVSSYVAKLVARDGTTTYYESILDALNAADSKDESTVVLLQDTNEYGTAALDGAAGGTIYFDLNGHYWRGCSSDALISDPSQATFVVQDSVGGGWLQNECTGATLGGFAVIKLEGGTVKGGNTAAAIVSYANPVYIYDGAVLLSSRTRAINANTLYFYGGEIYSNSSFSVTSFISNIIVPSGYTVSEAITQYNGYSYKKTYLVVPNYVATVTDNSTDTVYSVTTISSAFDRASSFTNSTIKLLNNVTGSASIESGFGYVTLDLNGYTWSSARLQFTDGGTFTVTGSGAITGSDSSGLITGVGSAHNDVFIESGTLANSTGYVVDNVAVYFNGGTLYGKSTYSSAIGTNTTVTALSGYTISSVSATYNGSSYVKTYLSQASYVAEVNGTKYTTFSAALGQLTNSSYTLTLLDDIEACKEATPVNARGTIDLNGNRIECMGEAYFLLIEEGSDITVKNGNIIVDQADNTNAFNMLGTSGSGTALTLTNVTVSAYTSYVVYGDSTSTVTINSGTYNAYGNTCIEGVNLNMNGGTLRCGSHAISLYDSSVVNINGGTIYSYEGYALYAPSAGTATIKQGAILYGYSTNSKGQPIFSFPDENGYTTSSFTIDGAPETSVVSVAEFLDSGTIYLTKMEVITTVATVTDMVTGTVYNVGTMQSAMNYGDSLSANIQIKLLKNVTGDASLEAPFGSVTLNLNGYTWSSASLSLTDTGSITINGNGTMIAPSTSDFLIGGTYLTNVTIESGTFVCSGGYVIDGFITLNFNGGTLYGKSTYSTAIASTVTIVTPNGYIMSNTSNSYYSGSYYVKTTISQAMYVSVTIGSTTSYYSTIQLAFNRCVEVTSCSISLRKNFTESPTFSGDTTVTFSFNGYTVEGTITNAGGEFTFSGTGGLTTLTNSSGSASLTGGSFTDVNVNGGTVGVRGATVSGTITNNEYLIINGGNVTNIVNNYVSSTYGYVDLMQGSISNLINKGNVEMTGGTVTELIGNGINATAYLQGGTVTTITNNSGYICVEGTTVGSITNSSNFKVESGDVTGTITNSGTLDVTGGTVGTVTNSSNTSTLSGGTITTVNVNGGTVTVSGATVGTATNGTATLSGQLNISGGNVDDVVNNKGTAAVSGGSVVTATNKSTFNVTDGSLSSLTNSSNTSTLSGGTINRVNVNGGTVTVNGATVTGTIFDNGDIYSKVFVINIYSGNINGVSITKANTTMTNGTISGIFGNYGGTISISGGNIDTLSNNSGTVNVTGGTVTSVTNSSVLNITGGSVIAAANSNAITNSGTLTIGDSSQVADQSVIVAAVDGYAVVNTGTFYFYGGMLYGNDEYNSAIDGNVVTPSGYGVINGSWVYNSSNCIRSYLTEFTATVTDNVTGTVFYSGTTIASALEAAASMGYTNTTVRLLKDVSGSASISDFGSITLDMNGKTWSSAYLGLNGEGTFTFTGNGLVTGDRLVAMIYGASSDYIDLYIESGTFVNSRESDQYTVYVIWNKSVYFNGGTLYGKSAPINADVLTTPSNYMFKRVQDVTYNGSSYVKGYLVEAFARIGTTKYETLQEALNDCGEEDTVYLLRDVSTAVTWTTGGTLNLAGYTMTGQVYIHGYYKNFVIDGNNGVMSETEEIVGGIFFSFAESLIIKNITIDLISSSPLRYYYEGDDDSCEAFSVSIENSTLRTEGSFGMDLSSSNCAAPVKSLSLDADTVIEGGMYGIRLVSYFVIDINGAVILGNTNAIYFSSVLSSGGAAINFNSGTLYSSTTSSSTYSGTIVIPNGYELVHSTGTYNGTTYKKGSLVSAKYISVTANNDTSYYSTIQQAFDYCVDLSSCTITLRKNFTESPTFSGNTTVTFNFNSYTVTGTITNAGGAFTFSGSGSLTTLTNSSGAATLSGGTITTVNVNGGTVTVNGATVSGTATNKATFNVSSGSVANVTNTTGTTTISSTGTVTGTITNSDTLNVIGGTIGTVINQSGTSSLSGGTLSYAQADGGTVTINGSTVTETVTNMSTLNMNSGNVNRLDNEAGTSTLSGGTITSVYVVKATVIVNGASVDNIYNSGTLNVRSGTVEFLTNSSSTSTLSGGTITTVNVNGGTVTVSGATVGTATNGTATLSGQLNISGGNVDDVVNNNGTAAVSGGSVVTATNKSTFNVTDGSLSSLTNSSNTSTLSGGTITTVNVNGGTVTVSGATVSGTSTNKATFNVSSGSVANVTNTSGTTTVSSTGTVTGTITNNATLKVTGGTVSTVTNSANTSTLSGGTITTVNVNGGTVIVNGATVSGTVTNKATFDIASGSVNNVINETGGSISITNATIETITNKATLSVIPSSSKTVTIKKFTNTAGTATLKTRTSIVGDGSNTALSVNGGTVTLEGAIVNATVNSTNKYAVKVASGSVLSFVNYGAYGNITSSRAGIENKGTVTISGGEVEGQNGYAVVNTGTFNFNGGTLYAAPYESYSSGHAYSGTAILPSGYVVSSDYYETGLSGYVRSTLFNNPVARIGNAYYGTLINALTACSSNTVILVKNFSENITTASLTANITCTLNLNGKTLTGNLSFGSGSNISITDTDGQGAIIGTVTNISTLNILGGNIGTITNSTSTVNVYAGTIDNINVNGGTANVSYDSSKSSSAYDDIFVTTIINKAALHVTSGNIVTVTNSSNTSTLSGGTITTVNVNGGTVTVNGATVSGTATNKATFNVSSGSVANVTNTTGTTTISSTGTVTGTITNAATLKVTGGTVGTVTNSSNTSTLSGGTITSVNVNGGTVTISGATVNGNSSYVVKIASGATLHLISGSITSSNAGVENKGTFIISAGSVNASSEAITNIGTLTIGDSAKFDDTDVVIKSLNGYAVVNTGTFEFFGGELYGKSTYTSAISNSGTLSITDHEQIINVAATVSGTAYIKTYLDTGNIIIDNGSTYTYYREMSKAISVVGSNNYTIRLIKDINECVSFTNTIIAKFDLNGMTWSCDGYIAMVIASNSTITIEDASGGDGVIQGIHHNPTGADSSTLTINDGVIYGFSQPYYSSTSNSVVMNGGKIIMMGDDCLVDNNIKDKFTITGGEIDSSGGGMSFAEPNAHIVMTGGKITTDSVVNFYGKLELKGGTINAALWVQAYGEIVISGGTINSKKYMSVVGSSTTLNGGTINGSVGMSRYASTFVFNSGVINSTEYYGVVFADNSESTFTFNGGTIKGSATNAYSYYVPSGTFNRTKSEWTTISGNQYVTTIVDKVAKIGSTYYDTLPAAINAASSGATITMEKDVTINSLSITKNLTLNLNERTINSYVNDVANNRSANVIVSGASVTVNGNGVIDASYNTGSNLFSLTSGSLTIGTSGYVTLKASKFSVVSASSMVNFNNGVLISTTQSSVFDVKNLYMSIKTGYHIEFTSSAGDHRAEVIINGLIDGDSFIHNNTITFDVVLTETHYTVNINGTKAVANSSVNLHRSNGDNIECTSSDYKSFVCQSDLGDFFDPNTHLYNVAYKENIIVSYSINNTSLEIYRDFVATIENNFTKQTTFEGASLPENSNYRSISTDGEIIFIHRINAGSFNINATDDSTAFDRIFKIIYGENIGSIISNYSSEILKNKVLTLSTASTNVYDDGVNNVRIDMMTFSLDEIGVNLNFVKGDITGATFKPITVIIYDYSPKTTNTSSLSNEVTCDYGSECNVETLTFTDYTGKTITDVETVITLDNNVVKSIDTSVAGTYLVKSIARDERGYTSAEIVRSYTVEENSIPVISLPVEPVMIEQVPVITYVESNTVTTNSTPETSNLKVVNTRSVEVTKDSKRVVTHKTTNSNNYEVTTTRPLIIKKSYKIVKRIVSTVLVTAVTVGTSLVSRKKRLNQ